MVFSRGQDMNGGRLEEIAAAGLKAAACSPVMQSRFHKFSFPTMSWGSQRILRCSNTISTNSPTGSTIPETSMEPRNESRTSSSPVSLLPIPPLIGGSKEKYTEHEESSSFVAEEAAAVAARPWNLRVRRDASCAPSGKGRNQHLSSSPSSLLRGKDDPGKVSMLRSMVGENARRKFSVSLLHEEIEEDFYAFKGTKPNRRPKKRARIVQRELDALFPGLWLSEVTVDSYKVVE